MWDNIYKNLSQIRQSSSGATLVYFALILPVFVGFAGLGFDATLWFMEKRQLQSVADSSAITAAYSLSKNETQQEIFLAATQDAGLNNFHIGGDNSISVVSPPATGAFVGQNNYVMVTISRPATGMFTQIMGREPTILVSTATAGILVSGEHCILALDESRDKALEFTGTSNVDINCGVASNSNSSESIYLNGTATLSADPSAQSYGDIYEGSNATLDTPNPIQPFSQRSTDPYGPDGRDLQVPTSPAGCSETGLKVKSNEGPVTLLPGRYCDGILLNAGADVTFAPGVYILDGGEFLVRGGAIVNGVGVTIILTASAPADVATMKINGGAEMNLTAPNSGTWAGIVFFQDSRALYESGSNNFLGGADMNIKGAVYFPSQEISYSGGAAGISGCLLLVGSKVTFSGNSVLVNDQADCDAVGITKGTIARTLVTLVE
ncbi:MAG: pilus assembly protein [Rhodobacteraceae bacterium]|nr:pilus assembly protein [Paracoccaceae bacterium]